MSKQLLEPVCVVGVDGGGTKTLAAVADLSGNVLGLGKSWSANFQGVGRELAREEIRKAVDLAMASAGVTSDHIATSAYGLAGADREKDFVIIAQDMLDIIDPAVRYTLCNDTTLALRAGTRDGVGVASVSGTGSNTMGFGAAGDHIKVGGFGEYSGDYGSSTDIFTRGVVAAMKAWDGRGPKTLISDVVCKELELEEICDIIEKSFFDNCQDPFLNRFAPLIFQAADMGDRQAIKVLSTCGRLVGQDVLSCMRRLFPDKSAAVPLVLGGSVYQKGSNPAMRKSLEKTVRRSYPNVVVKRLLDEPCVGAVLLAADDYFGKPAPAAFQKRVIATFKEKMKSLE